MIQISVSTVGRKNTVIHMCIYENHKKEVVMSIMINDALTKLQKAEQLIDDSRQFINSEHYYLNRVRDISSDLELLIEEIETHV